MRYTLSFITPHRQEIHVQAETVFDAENLVFHLPAWRPGRYELQSYGANISRIKAENEQGDLRVIEKIARNTWQVQGKKGEQCRLSYTYYANSPDAGGSFFSKDMIYVNGINLLVYCKETIDSTCELNLELPDGYQLAGDLQGQDNRFEFKDYHALVDRPFFAAKSFIHHQFEVAGIDTHFWFLGECSPDLVRMEQDIRAMTEAQVALFEDCPAHVYHYLYLILPRRFRHGVEHESSTVIVLGPGDSLMEPAAYRSMLEISSHELFHVWNVKSIRPKDMLPYDYSVENYSRLHYVTEGVTTYYGDLMLWKGGVWGLEEWIQSMNGELERFYRSSGREHVSLEEASFNSWINGYREIGMPNHRISFYTKGYLVSMLLDMEIRKRSDDTHSMDSVIREMYRRFGHLKEGYTREDYKSIIESFAGSCFDDFFACFISGTYALDDKLAEMAEYFGLGITMRHPPLLSEALLGIRYVDGDKPGILIEKIRHNSAVDAAMGTTGDRWLSINGQEIHGNFESLLAGILPLNHFEIEGLRHGKTLKLEIAPKENEVLNIPQFFSLDTISDLQKTRLEKWKQVIS